MLKFTRTADGDHMTSSTEYTSDKMEGSGEKKRKVIIAMDGSTPAISAFHWYVKHIYRPADLVILMYAAEFQHDIEQKYLYSSDEQTTSVADLAKSIEKHRKIVQEKVEDFKTILKSANIEGQVNAIDSKIPGKGIVTAANEMQASFIVTGTRGLGAIRRTISGSVSDYILHHSAVPVIICHEDE